MPVQWAVREGIVFITLMGHFEFQEIRAATVEAYAHPSTPPSAPLLVDGRASLVPLSSDEARGRGAWFGSLLEQGLAARCAIVVGVSTYRQHIVAEGIAPQQEAGLRLRSFTHFADAVTWLKAPE
jgi:hypothetical protein